MSNKAWIIFVAVCVVLFGSLIVVSNKQKLNVDDINTQSVLPATEDSGVIADHVFGDAKSKVILVEYGDYQCPGCGSAYGTIKQVTEKYKDQMGFVFRNFPLTSLHPNALIAAASAEAAGLQGKYWQMHDRLYANQSSWQSLSTDVRTDAMVDFASGLGLNVEQFKTDLKNPAIAKKIAFDQALGKKDGVTSTPTFILNGKAIDQYIKDGKIVPASTAGSNPIWSDAASFEKLIIIPALTDAGIALPKQ